MRDLGPAKIISAQECTAARDTVDYQSLAHIHAASFRSPPPWSADSLRASLDSRYSYLIQTCDPEGHTLGFLIGQTIAGEAELLTIAVLPKARRSGLGRKLLNQFLDHSINQSVSSYFLEVSAENPSAIALYESAGFTRQGLRKAYYRDPEGKRIDALVMTRVKTAC